jgi:hypothetical protein
MAKWKKQIAHLGLGKMVVALDAARKTISKKEYKRLLSTGVAQLLALHPDFGLGQARRRARKVTGAKPSRKAVMKPGAVLRKRIEVTAPVAVNGGAVKTMGKIGRGVGRRASKAGDSAMESMSNDIA